MVTMTLGKDVSVTGIANAVDLTHSESAATYDTTKKGDTYRRIVKGWIESTITVNCIDAPGCARGDSVTIAYTCASGFVESAKYLVVKVTKNEPLDGIITYDVELSRGVQ
jgi:hypothetical protein